MCYIKEFDGLRGLMAVWVLFGHWATAIAISLPRVPDNLGNNYAVDVFIVLSGFAIATLLDRRKENYGSYLIRRILRIFPVYWFYLVISVALASVAVDVWTNAEFGAMQNSRAAIANAAVDNFWANVLAHIPALHAVVPTRFNPLGEFAFLGQAWSISLEWQFYLVAPFAIGALVAASNNWKIATGLVLTLLVLAVIARYMPGGFIGNYSDKFAIGIGTYYLFKWRLPLTSSWLSPQRATALTALVIAGLFLAHLPSALPLAIWVVVVGSVLSMGWGPLSLLSTALTIPAVTELGKMSYSVYLSHMIPLTLGMLILRHAGIGGGALHTICLLVITVVGTLVLSLFSYKFVEVPFQTLGKRLSKPTAAI